MIQRVLFSIWILSSVFGRFIFGRKNPLISSRKSSSIPKISSIKSSPFLPSTTTIPIADLIATRPILDYPNPEFLDEKVLQKRLPWQIGLFLKVNSPQPDIEPIEPNDKAFLTILQHPFLDSISSFLRRRFSFLFDFIGRYKHRLLVIVRGVAIVWIGYYMVKRLIHWYTGITEYELLLDAKDYEYQRYGSGTIDDLGTTYLARLNSTFTQSNDFQNVVDKVALSLNRPCFPHTMKSYAVQIGKDIAEILMILDSKIRSYRKSLSLVNSENGNSASISASNFDYQKDYYLKTSTSDLPPEELDLTEEAVTLFTLQRLITLLQVRQADAYLRLSRMSVLSATNLCEDLLEFWKAKVIRKSQTLRIPIFQTLISKVLGFSVGIRSKTISQMHKALNIMNFYEQKREIPVANFNSTTNYKVSSSIPASNNRKEKKELEKEEFKKSIEAEYIDDMLRDLNAREKIVVLENLLRNLYTITGEIQYHLEIADSALATVSLKGCSDKNDGTVLDENEEYEDDERTPLEIKLRITSITESNSGWSEVENWVGTAARLSQKAMSIVSIRTKFTSSESPLQTSPLMRRTGRMSIPSLVLSGPAATSTITNTEATSIDGSNNSTSSLLPIDQPHEIDDTAINDTDASAVNVKPYYSEEIVSFLSNRSDDIGNIPVTSAIDEFTLPGSVSQILELTIANDSYFNSILEEHTAATILKTVPWRRLQDAAKIYNNSYISPSSRNFAFREIIFESEAKASLLAKWSPYQSITKVLNLRSLYYSSEEEREAGFATVAMFRDFSQSSTNSLLGNITMVWKLENVVAPTSPATNTAVLPLASSPTVYPPRSSYGYYRSAILGSSIKSQEIVNSQQTKVSIQIEIKVNPSLYYYFLIAIMTTESKRFITTWRSATLNAFNQFRTNHLFATNFLRTERNDSDFQSELLSHIRSVRFPPDENNDETDEDSRPFYSHEFIAKHSSSAKTSIPQSSPSSSSSNSAEDENTHIHRQSEDLLTLNSIIPYFNQNMQLHRQYWRSSAIVLRDINKATSAFNKHLETIGLKKPSKRLLIFLLSPKYIARFSIWAGILLAGLELNKRSNTILWTREFFMNNMKDFINRRIATPTLSIVNDVLLNKRTSITDRQALLDAKRSLSSMLYDFLLQEYPKLSESERRKAAITMDMTPISVEYERELKRPIQNIVSGKILRIVLIQLQFVKKELLVAMEAIDQLFNANQVNLQLLAITPALVAIFSLQVVARGVIAAVKSISRGKALQSTSVIHQDLRNSLRELERLLTLSNGFEKIEQEPRQTSNSSFNAAILSGQLSPAENGRLLSQLHRVQLLLVLHSSNFDYDSLKKLQEDLRDLSTAHITIKQRLLILDRIHRRYSFLQPNRGLFGMI